MTHALQTNQVQAAWMVEPFVTYAEMTGAEPLADTDSGATQNLPIAGYMVTQSWEQKYPGTAAAFRRALLEGQRIASVKPFGKPLAANQAIQFPLVELQTQCEMLRALIHKTAWLMDTHGPFSASDKVSMCNYWANRLCCEAADRAMQVHGGLGYSRHKPFEHIYRHRRYRITEGTEEIQMRRVATCHRRHPARPGPARTADGERTAGGRPGVPHRPGHARQYRPAGFPRPRRRERPGHRGAGT
jgi:Acyl-CoA dehydrogenase, C-terminal domain